MLDFGLVKDRDPTKTAEGANRGLVGTPLYMSPEAIQSPLSVDARSDLYAVGAVGYFLLTGEPVFSAKSMAELMRMQVDDEPRPPSDRTQQPISAELENALLRCLDKSRMNRPNTARELAQSIEKSPMAHQWTVEDAEVWWGRHQRASRKNMDNASNSVDVSKAGNSGQTFDQTMDFS